jgi:4-hydroxy-tetrahydrodipicolinate reductase
MGIKIGIIGCAGRMGRMLVAEVLANKACTLAGGVEPAGSPFVGHDMAMLIGEKPCKKLVTDNVEALVKASDAIIDFTAPESTLKAAALAAKAKKIHVIGTTGFSEKQIAELRRHASKTAIVFAPNMSVGVNLLASLVRQVAGALGEDDFDIEVLEMHHSKKVDAPSGTALALGKAAAEGRKVKLEKVARRERDGVIGARPKGEIGFATLRGGDVIGDHTIIFAGDGERIELTHKASSRTIYAKGAVRAALWAKGKKPGLYTMKDILDIG